MSYTIITINFNNKSGLIRTVKSVLCQEYKNIEYIVVDGCSTDGSIRIINENTNLINKKIIEPDKGIFHAMNKGIKLSTGDYIIFMNSGDTFYSKKSLNKINSFVNKNRNADIIYGKSLVEYDKNYSKIDIPNKDLKFNYGLPFCHQSMTIKRDIQQEFLFDENYQIYGAYDLYFKLWKNGYEYIFFDEIISRYDYDGISSNFSWLGLKEKYLIGAKYKKFNDIKFLVYFFDNVARDVLKKMTPHQLRRKIQTLK